MGLSPFSKCSKHNEIKYVYIEDSCTEKNSTKLNPNPNPTNYEIIESVQIKNNLLLKVKYIGCTNFEGNKILLFKNTKLKDVVNKPLDPHFCDKCGMNLVARFIPNKAGWDWAIKMAQII